MFTCRRVCVSLQSGYFALFQGHTKKLHKLFEKAGLMLPVVKREELAQQAKHLEKVAGNHEKGEFESLETCSQVGQKHIHAFVGYFHD